jgi:hypothetical protein
MRDPILGLRVVIAVTVLAGAGDLLTGFFLVLAPEWTLSLMRIPAVDQPVFIGFIGCFVSAVGFSYFWGLAAWFISGSIQRLRIVWEITMVFRIFVGSFVVFQVMRELLALSWLSVAITDWLWAAVQGFSIRAGVFRILER